MTISMTTILPIIAIILSIGAIVSVALIPQSDTDLETRLNEQQSVIMQNRGLITNNTIFIENQFQFNNDVIGWAGNVTADINTLANRP